MAPAAGTVGDCFDSTLPLLCMNPLAGKLLLLSAALRMYQHAAGVCTALSRQLPAFANALPPQICVFLQSGKAICLLGPLP